MPSKILRVILNPTNFTLCHIPSGKTCVMGNPTYYQQLLTDTMRQNIQDDVDEYEEEYLQDYFPEEPNVF